MLAGDAEAESTGMGFTVTVSCEEAEQPAVVVPVTEYVVFVVGHTLTVAPVRFPGIQVYVEAPLALRLVHCPEHIAAGEAATVFTGLALTVTVAVLVAEQPAVVVPVTVYVVEEVGHTLIKLPFRLPGIQV
jgi:hypothetical protein